MACLVCCALLCCCWWWVSYAYGLVTVLLCTYALMMWMMRVRRRHKNALGIRKHAEPLHVGGVQRRVGRCETSVTTAGWVPGGVTGDWVTKNDGMVVRRWFQRCAMVFFTTGVHIFNGSEDYSPIDRRQCGSLKFFQS